MPEPTPIVLAMDANADPAGTADLAKTLLELGVEGTLLVSAETAKRLKADHPLTEVCKRLDVGLLDRELAEPEARDPALFGPRFAKLHDAVLFPAGRLPSVYMCPSLPLGGFATLSEVNIRAVMTESPRFLANDAVFLGGRLLLSHLHPLQQLADDDDIGNTLRIIASQASIRDDRATVALLLPNPERMTARALTAFLKRLLENPGFAVGSVRQVADRFADIPYDHSIQMAAIAEMATFASKGTIAPFRYALGWLCPAEQLYLLVAVWTAALEKGKSPRTAQTRTPIPTLEAPVESTATMIAASQLPTVIAGIHAFVAGRNELPAGVSFEGGVIGMQDLLPTLAASLSSLPTPVDLPIVKGTTKFSQELKGLGRLAWTHKLSTG